MMQNSKNKASNHTFYDIVKLAFKENPIVLDGNQQLLKRPQVNR